MLNFTVDYAQVELVENIPLSKDDLNYIEKKRKFYKVIPIVMAFATLLVMGFACWLIRDHFKTFRYYDYLLLAGATVGLYAVGYFCGWLVISLDVRNWKKDIQFGKCKLTSVIINRDKTEYGEYLTFAGPLQKDTIRVQVTEADYKQYKTGTKIMVEYLKYSKEALLIVAL